MEAIMVVPPDRGTIIGRALWKPRYVVVGPQRRADQPSVSTARLASPKDVPGDPETTYLSVYKSRSDWEPVQQVHISSITDCQVQMVAHRKQGPVLPTLVVTLSPDPATDKLRKRRSSRTAGLTSSKEMPSNIMWFRPGDDSLSLHDWAKYITTHMQPRSAMPMSPMSPNSPTFMNPFAPRHREPSEYSQRPPSGNPNSRAPIRPSLHTYSDSPSLRSKRSDISSHASMMNQPHGAYGHYTAVRPADLPSPAPTIQDYPGEFIEGWTAAQGRSSTVSSPVKGRDSIGSQVLPPIIPQNIDSSSPPGPRETILDRAFQLRCIPGSENTVPGEEKLSSLARFEALMQEADKKRESRETAERKARPPPVETARSAWDHDDEDSDSDDLNDEDDSPTATRAYGRGRRTPQSATHSTRNARYGMVHDHAHEADLEEEEDVVIPQTAQRALDFITGRRSPTLPGPPEGGDEEASFRSPRSPHEIDPDNFFPVNNSVSPHQQYHQHLRPDAAPQRRHKSGFAQQTRTNSQPHLAAAAQSGGRSPRAHANSSSSSFEAAGYPHSASPYVTGHPAASGRSSAADLGLVRRNTTMSTHSASTTATEKRLSTSSAKRLSFTEHLTKRLSSTSSLLLVQSNTSASGSRGSATVAEEQHPHQLQHQHYQHPQHHHQYPPPERCGWRGSVGVIGAEGGFL